MQETPKKVRDDVERVIDQLNNAWPGLSLPKPGRDGWEQAEDLTRSVCLHIKFILKIGIDIRGVIQRFNAHAKKFASEWIEKPSQQEGTILARPLPKTFIKSDVFSQSKQHLLSFDLQQSLLAILDGMLRDEKTATESSRNSSSTASTSETRSIGGRIEALESDFEVGVATFVPQSMAKKKGQEHPRAAKVLTSAKRSSLAAENEPSKIPKKVSRTSTIKDHFPVKPYLDSNPAATTKAESMQETTFRSAQSPPQANVFTPPEHSVSSNDTSIMSFEDCSSGHPDLMPEPTQEVLDLMDSPLRRSFEEIGGTAQRPERGSSPLIAELEKNGPFSACGRQLPLTVPFAFRYEFHRIGKAIGKSPIELFGAFKQQYREQDPSYDELWKFLKNFAKELGKKLPEKGSTRAWEASLKKHGDTDTGHSVNLSGDLEWPESGSMFNLKLAPLKLDRSCRLHRRFGPDRFMVLTLPFFTAEKMPKILRDKNLKNNILYESICDWLAKSTHLIAGRNWRLFWLDAEKGKKRQDVGPRLRAHMFAIDGIDFQVGASHISSTQGWRKHDRHHPLGVDQLIYWHLRIRHNLKSTDLKCFSRFSLGLSKTISTVQLKAEEFLELKNVEGESVMNDGCALMSFKLAKAIAVRLGLVYIPSAFQGRISGAKGLWMTDYNNSYPQMGNRGRGYWIEISDLQLKIQPHPRSTTHGDDPEQCTFEVLKYSTAAKPAFLNNQLLQVLAHHKVEQEVLKETLIRDVETYFDALILAKDSAPKLRHWVQQYHRPPRSTDPIRHLGAFPDAKEEKVNLLLESGFTTDKSELLNNLLCQFLKDHLNQYVEKLHIKMPNSTAVFCIADPYGVLDVGEVHLGFSETWRNPKSGVQDNGIYDLDVLVARNPALLPSDIQKVRAVFKEKLRHYRDVIVFSTKGDIPLASLLSGGDYDGDTVWVCWDPLLLKKFVNSTKPRSLPSVEECGIEKKSRPMLNAFTAEDASPSAVDDFLAQCVWFAAQSSLLGNCTVEHEKLVYHGTSLSSPNSIKLATLAGYLVDASKQGYLLTESAWTKLRSKVSPKFLERPAYKGDKKPKDKGGDWEGYANVIDWLKFGVAENKRGEVLAQFYEKFDFEASYDKDLGAKWNEARSRIEKGPQKPRNKIRKELLDDVEFQVKALIKDYKRKVGTESNKSFERDPATFSRTVREIHERFVAIEPLALDDEIRDLFIEENAQQFNTWTALRASCAYYHYSMGRFAWSVAGFDLCRIKAATSEDSRTIVGSMHNLMKMDGKLMERLTGEEDDLENRTDGFVDEDNQQDLIDSYFGCY